jgi:hypothetical protein
MLDAMQGRRSSVDMLDAMQGRRSSGHVRCNARL